MPCSFCKSFIHDFLNPEIHKDLDLAKQIHVKRLPSIRSQLADWIYLIFSKLEKEEFDSALRLASCIARRGRKAIEYEFVVCTAAFRLLKCKVPWLATEIAHIKVLLLEACILKKAHKAVLLTFMDDYVSYVSGRTLVALFTLHEDHLKPKGLFSNTNQLLHKEEERNAILELLEEEELYA